MKQVISIGIDGKVRYVGDNDIASGIAGSKLTKRASHILPRDTSLRLLFKVLRACSSDDSRIAAWTRTWECQWMVRINDGPEFGPFDDRQTAIEYEIDYLQRHKL